MLVYWIVFFILAFLALGKMDKRKAFLYSFIILMILGATRGSTVGNDMRGGYSAEFYYIHADPSTWGSVMYQFEVGFAWLMGNFKDYVSDNKMLFFHSLFFVTFLMRYYPIKWYSCNGALTLLFMFGLGYYFAMYNTMRQELAFSIICLFLPLVIEQKRYALFAVATVITALLFHKSQVVLLLFIPMAMFYGHRWLNFRNLSIILVASYVLGLTAINKILGVLGQYAYIFAGGNSNYAGYMTSENDIGNFSTLTTLLHTLFCIYVLYLHRHKNDVFLLCYVVGVVILNLLTPISWIYQRIAYAFMYFSIFVFTYLWHGIPSRNERGVFRFAVIAYLVVLFSRRLITDNGEDVVPYINYFFE